MSLDDIAEVKRLRESGRITEGDWKLWGGDVMSDPIGNSDVRECVLVAHCPNVCNRPNAENPKGLGSHVTDAYYIAAMARAMPTLLSELDRLTAERNEARQMVHLAQMVAGARWGSMAEAIIASWPVGGVPMATPPSSRVAILTAERDAAESELAAFRAKDPRPLCFNCGAPCEACAQLKVAQAEIADLKERLDEIQEDGRDE